MLFADGKEEGGLDHYQLMSATAIVLLDLGDAGLRLLGRGAAPLAAVATPCLHWRGAPRNPAPSSPLAAALALCAVPIQRST